MACALGHAGIVPCSLGKNGAGMDSLPLWRGASLGGPRGSHPGLCSIAYISRGPQNFGALSHMQLHPIAHACHLCPRWQSLLHGVLGSAQFLEEMMAMALGWYLPAFAQGG